MRPINLSSKKMQRQVVQTKACFFLITTTKAITIIVLIIIMERLIIHMGTRAVVLMKKITTYMNRALKTRSSTVTRRKIRCMITSHPKKNRALQRLLRRILMMKARLLALHQAKNKKLRHKVGRVRTKQQKQKQISKIQMGIIHHLQKAKKRKTKFKKRQQQLQKNRKEIRSLLLEICHISAILEVLAH